MDFKESAFAHLNHIETNVLVEGIKDEFSQPLIAPCTMNKKQLVQITELRKRQNEHILQHK